MSETVQQFTLRQALIRLEALEFQLAKQTTLIESLQGRLSNVECRGDLSIARPTWRDLDRLREEFEHFKKSR